MFFFFFSCRFYFSLKPPFEPSAQTTPPGVQTQQKDTAIFSLLADSLPVSMGEWPGIAHLSGGGNRLYGFALWHPRACVCDGTPGSAHSEGLHSLRGPELTQRACAHSEGLRSLRGPALPQRACAPSEGLQKHLLWGVKKETLDSLQRSTGPVNQEASQGQPRAPPEVLRSLRLRTS